MTPTWDYLQARITDTQTVAEQRRRAAGARRRPGTSRVRRFLRTPGRRDDLGGCR